MHFLILSFLLKSYGDDLKSNLETIRGHKVVAVMSLKFDLFLLPSLQSIDTEVLTGKVGERKGLNTFFKGSDRLCQVVELRMQCCGKLLLDSFETYNTFERSVNPDFERKFDV